MVEDLVDQMDEKLVVGMVDPMVVNQVDVLVLRLGVEKVCGMDN